MELSAKALAQSIIAEMREALTLTAEQRRLVIDRLAYDLTGAKPPAQCIEHARDHIAAIHADQPVLHIDPNDKGYGSIPVLWR